MVNKSMTKSTREQYKKHANRLLELQDLLIKFAEVERRIYFPDRTKKDRLENDAEHSYNLAMAAWYLSSHFPHLDRDKLIRYALAHDFVEVHAGDVMAIGRTEEADKQKNQREIEALRQLEKDWPDFEDLLIHISTYEELADAESRFIYALDKIMPMLLNIISDGKTWRTYKLTRQSVLESKDTKVAISPEINELWKVFRKQILENELYFAHEKQGK